MYQPPFLKKKTFLFESRPKNPSFFGGHNKCVANYINTNDIRFSKERIGDIDFQEGLDVYSR